MIKLIGYLLDRITMYRLVLYILIALVCISIFLGTVQLISFSPFNILLSTFFLVCVCWLTNKVFSWAFNAPTNIESALITGLILALIVNPAATISECFFLFWIAVLAMASKYILAIQKKHIFNPVAIAAVLTTLFLNESASWWVGNVWMAPFVAFSGYLIIRKLHFDDLAWSFFSTALIISLSMTLFRGGNVLTTLNQVMFHSSFLFLGSIMLTEPLTLPPTKNLQIIYGAIVGFLFVPQVNLAGLYFAPELALGIGNIFAYIVSPKVKLVLNLHEKIRASSDIFDFVFLPGRKIAYQPGQYMEWTLPHPQADSRGNRRYFTLASSPTEANIRLGIKFYANGSSYKKALQDLDQKTPLIGAQLAGSFTLPREQQKKLVFIAGGIGVTPYRSMLKYLVDKNERRDIVMFYANRIVDEIVYKDVFDAALTTLGIRTIYTLTKADSVPPSWNGRVGRIDAAMIKQEVPDYAERIFYLSGPYQMITAVEEVLKNMGVKGNQIKKDFFPGLV